jgi:hypothetical protein
MINSFKSFFYPAPCEEVLLQTKGRSNGLWGMTEVSRCNAARGGTPGSNTFTNCMSITGIGRRVEAGIDRLLTRHVGLLLLL